MSRFGNLEFNRQQESVARQETLSDEECAWGEAERALRRGDFERALRSYARVLELNPARVSAWVGQVRMLVELGSFGEASAWADKALERFPHEAEVLAAKAVALARRGDDKAAMTYSDASVEEQSPSPYVWLARGDVLLARGEKRSEYCFTKAIAAGASDWLWPWLASRVHVWYRRFSRAMKLASQALALDSGQAVLWVQMGRCQLALGLAGVAAESLDQARELDAQCPDLSRVRGESVKASWWSRGRECLRSWTGG